MRPKPRSGGDCPSVFRDTSASRSFSRLLVRVVAVFACCAISIGVSAAAASAGSVTYVNPVYSVAPSYHGGPPGNAWDPCNVSHSYGGWAWNYGDYYDSGDPTLQIVTTDNGYPCGQWSACSVYSATEHDINDNGCTAWYSWFAGNYADILVGTYSYSHTIYGTGTWR